MKFTEIKIIRSQKKNDPKIVDHKKSQDQDHAITKSGEIRIIRSRRNYSWIKLFSNLRSQDHVFFRVSDHTIMFFSVSQITRSCFFPYLRSQDHVFFRISDHKIMFFPVSQITRSSFSSYLRSQDHIFPSEIARSNIN